MLKIKYFNITFFYLFLCLSLHIIASFFSIGFYSDDEHFQILEITAYLLGINEVAINDPTGFYWEWEENIRMRPWLQPFIFYKIINVVEIFSSNPFLWTLILRIISSILGFISIILLYFTFKDIFFYKNKIFNTFLFFTFWFYPFIHSRTSSENISIALFIISFCILYKSLFTNTFKLNFEQGFELTLMMFLSIWVCDTFAFIFGGKYGKKKLSPLSPNKTWLGSICGFFGSLFIPIVFYLYSPISTFIIYDYLICGLIFGIFGQIGDLFESALKREANIKDTSNILHGHGGILDRFDSLSFASPVLFIFLSSVKGFS